MNVNESKEEINETVELGSQQVTEIEVFHLILYDNYMMGLIFYTEEKEIARIGMTTIDEGLTSTMIELQEGEIWCGVAASVPTNGYMSDF